VLEPGRKGGCSVGDAGEDLAVGPFGQQGSVEALDVAVPPGAVGPDKYVLDAVGGAQLALGGAAAVGKGVVGHQPLDSGDAVGCEVLDRLGRGSRHRLVPVRWATARIRPAGSGRRPVNARSRRPIGVLSTRVWWWVASSLRPRQPPPSGIWPSFLVALLAGTTRSVIGSCTDSLGRLPSDGPRHGTRRRPQLGIDPVWATPIAHEQLHDLLLDLK
jgi:hypothetical protein